MCTVPLSLAAVDPAGTLQTSMLILRFYSCFTQSPRCPARRSNLDAAVAATTLVFNALLSACIGQWQACSPTLLDIHPGDIRWCNTR